MKKLTTYLLSTGCIIAAAAAMGVAASADVTIDSGAFEKNAEDALITSYDSADKFAAALAKAKPTGAMEVTFNGEKLTTALKFPKTLDSVTISGTIDASKAKGIAFECTATLSGISLTGGDKVKITSKGDVSLTGDSTISNFGALSGSKTGKLNIASTSVVDFNFPVSGFGEVAIAAGTTVNFTGGSKGDALKAGTLDVVKGGTESSPTYGTVVVKANPISVDTLKGEGKIVFKDTASGDKTIPASYVTVKKSVSDAKLKVYDQAATATDTTYNLFDSSNKVFVIKAKDYEADKLNTDNGLKLDGATGTNTQFSYKKGVLTAKASAYQIGTATAKYCTWDEVMAVIAAAGDADAEYTVKVLADVTEDGAIKFPKKDTYKKISVESDTTTVRTLKFTGGIKASGDLSLKKVLLYSYKYDKSKTGNDAYVPVQFDINAGKYNLELEDIDTYSAASKYVFMKSISADNITLKSGNVRAIAIKGNKLYVADNNVKVYTNSIAAKSGIFDATGTIRTTANRALLTFVDKKTTSNLSSGLNKVKVVAAQYGNQFVIQNGTSEDTYKLVYSGSNLIPTDTQKETAFGLYGKTGAFVDADYVLAKADGTAGAGAIGNNIKNTAILFKSFKDIAKYIESAAKADSANAAKNYAIVVYKPEKNVALAMPKADTYKRIVIVNGATDPSATNGVINVKGKLNITGELIVEDNVKLVFDKPEKAVTNKNDALYINKEARKADVIDALNNVETTYTKWAGIWGTNGSGITSEANIAKLKAAADDNIKATDTAKKAIKALEWKDGETACVILLKAKKANNKWDVDASTSGIAIKEAVDTNGKVTGYGNGVIVYDTGDGTGANAVPTYKGTTAGNFNDVILSASTQNVDSGAIKTKLVTFSEADETTVAAKDMTYIAPDASTGISKPESGATDSGKIKISVAAAAGAKAGTHKITVVFQDGSTATVNVTLKT